MNCCFHSDGLTVYLSCEPVERQEGRGGGIGEGMEGRKEGLGAVGSEGGLPVRLAPRVDLLFRQVLTIIGR